MCTARNTSASDGATSSRSSPPVVDCISYRKRLLEAATKPVEIDEEDDDDDELQYSQRVLITAVTFDDGLYV